MPRSLKPALITSFVTGGMADPGPLMSGSKLQLFQDADLGAEIYCFMLPDARLWARKLARPEPSNAVEFLAELQKEHLREIAGSLVKCYERDLRVPIIALATYVPEVAVRHRQTTAVPALVALIRLALEIRRLTGRTPVIELVAGSRLDVHWSPEQIKIELSDETQQRLRVLDCVHHALKCVAKDEDLQDVRLAWELEPGEMFLLRDGATVDAFFSAIEEARSPWVREHVGFNVDVSHYRLAEVPLSTIRDDPRVRRRLFHAHLSGHHPHGHYGDTALLAFDDGEGLRPWLSFLQELTEENQRFSGYVSLEYEAARSPTAIRDSVSAMRRLLVT